MVRLNTETEQNWLGVRDADTWNVDHLYDHSGLLAYSLAYRMLGNEIEAEEAVREGFMAHWRATPRVPLTPDSERAMLLRAVRYSCIHRLRRATHSEMTSSAHTA